MFACDSVFGLDQENGEIENDGLATQKSSARIDIIGKRFGRRVVVDAAGNDDYGKSLVVAECDCGNTNIVRIHDLENDKANQCKNCHGKRIAEQWEVNVLIGTTIKSIKEWSTEDGAVHYSTIKMRLNRSGWSPISSIFGDRTGKVDPEILDRYGLSGYRVV